MAEGTRFQAVIAAVYKATGPLRQIMQGLRGMGEAAHHAGGHMKKLGHDAEHAGHGVKHAGDDAKHSGEEAEKSGRHWMSLGLHMHLLHHHLGELNAGFAETRESMTQFLPALEALGAGASLAGLFEVTNKVAVQRSELAKTAGIIGISAEKLEGLNFAAKMTDVPLDTLSGGLTKLNRGIALAATGKNKDLAEMFKHIGLSARDAHGHLRDAASVLPELSEAIRKTQDPAMRTRMAMAAFGKSGAEMLPLLMQGKEGLEKFQEQAEKTVAPVSEEQQESLEKFHRSWLTLGEAAEGFETSIGAKLAPVLTPIVDAVTNWVTANREWIATGIAKEVQTLGNALGKIDWVSVVQGATDFVHSALDLAESAGGAKTILGALAFLMASPLIAAFGTVIEMVKGTAEVLLGTFIEAVGAAFTALASGEGVMAAFNAVLIANPIGAVISAITLLGVAGYELYEHWDKVGPFFKTLWDDVKKAFAEAWAYISPIVDKVAAAASAIANNSIVKGIGHAASAAVSAASYVGNGAVSLGERAFGGGTPALASVPGGMNRSLPSPYAKQPGPAQAKDGHVAVTVTLAGAPPGTSISANSSGIAQPPKTSVGYGYHQGGH